MARTRRGLGGAPAALLALALVTGPLPARGGDAVPSAGYSALTGVGAVIGTLVYSPLKLAYALGGSVISGLAWAWTLGDTSVSGPILRSAVKGDYVLTPEHLEGQRKLHFMGPSY